MTSAEIDILVELHRAMLYSITPNMRFIFLEVQENRKVLMYFYFEKEPSKIEQELMDDICGSLLAGSEYVGNYEFKYFVTDKKASEVEHLKFFVYARFEDFGQFDDIKTVTN